MSKPGPVIALLLLLPAGAAASPSGLSGVWGGDDMVATFSKVGARLEAGCAQGEISGPVRLNKSGRFAQGGVFQVFHGGPQRADEDAAAPNARFAGQVRSGILELDIVVQDDPTPRHYVLRRGVRPKLVRCL